MISRMIVKCVDATLDDQVSQQYKDQPLAQDWARVAKVIEEAGEAISELIAYTGQNPRKGGPQEDRINMLLAELADAAMTPVYAIQHFTKNIEKTEEILRTAQIKHHDRLCPA